MADTKDFDVIRVCRTDGVDSGPGYWPVANNSGSATSAAKKAVSDKAPRTKPQMTRLAEDDPKFIEFRVKLGILLKQELSPHPDGKSQYCFFNNQFFNVLTASHNIQRGILGMFSSPADTGCMRSPSISGSQDIPSKQSCSNHPRSSLCT